MSEAPSNSVVCPACRQTVSVPVGDEGGAVACPKCGAALHPAAAAKHVVETLWAKTLPSDATVEMTLKDPSVVLSTTASTTSGRLRSKPKIISLEGVKPEPPPDYELLRLLGEGGMGVVYEARQVSVDRKIALKLIKPEVARDQNRRDEFLSEAIVTADLSHPNIVPVHELGTNEAGVPFYAMKAVQGRPWKDLIRQKTQDENLEILLRVADAVAFAHSRGIVHRDLKPENVMLGDFGEVLVMDWGLAVAHTVQGKAEPIGERTGVGGTPCYMAPEMATGETAKLGPASDVYLLGAILYEIVTGLRPHPGTRPMDCLANAAENRIQPTAVKSELVDVALKAMATEPGDRFDSVKGFQQAVRNCQIHFQSVALADKAEGWLSRAGTSRDYGDFSKAMLAFEEALELWTENATARNGARTARRAYAACAFDKGDLDLSLSLLEAGELTQHPLAQQVREARHERDLRQKRLKAFRYATVALAGAVFISITVAFFRIREEQAQTLVQKDRAEAEQKKAEVAADLARGEQKKAVAAQQEEVRQRVHAERQNYINLIALTDRRIKDGDIPGALGILENPTYIPFRGWEWGRLRHLCDTEITIGGGGTEDTPCAYSPDGRLVLTGNKYGNVDVWDSRTGQLVKKLREGGRVDGVFAVAFAPDNRTVATGQDNGHVVIWDSSNATVTVNLDAHVREVNGLCFTTDGTRLVSVGNDGKIFVIDVKAGKVVKDLPTGATAVLDVDVCRAGTAATAEDTGKVRIWDTGTWLEKKVHQLHGDKVLGVALSPDGRLLATASADGTARLWEADSGKPVRVLGGHAGPVNSVAFSPEGNQLLTGGSDGAVMMWDTASGLRILRRQPHRRGVNGVHFNPRGGQILTGSFEQIVKLWDPVRGSAERVLMGHLDNVRTVACSADGRIAATASYDGFVKIWDTDAGREVGSLHGHYNSANLVILDDEGKVAVTTGGDRTVKVWDVGSGRCRLTLSGFKDNIGSVALHTGLHRILTSDDSGAVRLWDLGTGREIRAFSSTTNPVGAVAFGPDGRVGFSGGDDGKVVKWDLETGKPLLTIHASGLRVVALAIREDGKRLLTGCSDSMVALWDAETGEQLRLLKGHGWVITDVAFFPDGRRAFSSSSDRTARVWDLETGQELLILPDSGVRGIMDVAVASKAPRVFTANFGPTASIWDATDWTTGAVSRAAGDRSASGDAAAFRRLDVDAHLRQAADHLISSEYEQAIRNFDRAAELDSKCALAYAGRARTRYWQGKYPEALQDSDKAIEADPADVQWVYLRAYIRRWTEQYEGALKDFNTVLRSWPEDGFALMDRANVRVRLADHEGALADMRQVLAQMPGSFIALRSSGYVAMAGGRFRSAREYLDAAITMAPDIPGVYSMRAQVQLWTGRYQDALADINRALELLPTDLQALALRAHVKVRFRDFDGAIADTTKVIQGAPTAPQGYEYRMQALWQRGDLKAAVADAETVLKQNPRNSEALWFRCGVLEQMWEWEKALADLDAALAIRPGAVDYVTEKAAVLKALGRDDESRQTLEGLKDDGVRLAAGSAVGQRAAKLKQVMAGRQLEGKTELTPAERMVRGMARVWSWRQEEGVADLEMALKQDAALGSKGVWEELCEVADRRGDWKRHAALLRTLAEDAPDKAVVLAACAEGMMDIPVSQFCDLDFALRIATKAVEATKRRDPAVLATLAKAQQRRGEPAAALKTVDEAIGLLSAEADASQREPFLYLRRQLDDELKHASVTGG